MYGFRHILFLLSTAFLVVLSAVSCAYIYDNPAPCEEPQLMVSLYIPGSTMTRAETSGMVSPLEAERKITSLQIWVFLSEDGTLVSYRSFGSNLDQTGLPNSSITRFGMPLTQDKFKLLTATPSPKVDVYVLANAESAVLYVPVENTSRDDLDQLFLQKFIPGTLTTSVPSTGLPMSGVLKGASVSGGYPVLSIPSLKLIRAVSKVRFVFCQQGTPATGSANSECAILGVKFDGDTEGSECKVASKERLFTTNAIDFEGYTALSASISGMPLIPNSKLSIVEDPEELIFRSEGHGTEDAEQYEARLDAAVASESQIGPIYLRETDKSISGTITYRTSQSGPELSAPFKMAAGGFPRNHTWIVYACFVEETMKLQLKVVVLPWEWSGYNVDYTDMVNVVRRFTVAETTPPSFKKVQTTDGYYHVSFWHHIQVNESTIENVLEGDIIISTPVGGKLHCIPVPGKDGGDPLTNAFIVTPTWETIYPNYLNMENGRIEDCRIPIQIKCNTAAGYTDEQLEGNYIDLHFSVETRDGRFIDLDSESIDYYRFILKKNWNQ